ncbi:MAG TPA: transcription-repair coupling factor, partial [Acidimicrobiales bacterium]|nr:transcription-repair coupling factor [Acidimicrobiales bacterium]
MSLRSLPALLRREPAMVDALVAGSASLAVSDAATAYVLAGMRVLGERRPLLVVTATVADAERLTHDLQAFLPTRSVALFPAWETLPFERVSPEVATMGRRLELLWRLGADAGGDGAEDGPDVVVAPVRALLQRLGPLGEEFAPVVVEPGARVDQQDLVAELVRRGYRREYQVDHRGELAVRGG